MDRLTIAFSERVFISLLFALIGFMAIRYGYNLFLTGVGLKKEKGKLKFVGPKVKIEMLTSSVGSGLMLTSAVWGGLTYLSLPTLSSDRVASTDTIIRGLALGGTSQLTTADTTAITDFARKAQATLKFNPNAKVWIVTTPGTPDEVSKRKAAVSDALTKAGFPESKIDKKVMNNAVQFNDVVKAIDPANRLNNLDTAIILAPNS